MVMNCVDFRMDVLEAVSAPRVSFIEPDTIAVEAGIPEAVREALEARGHRLRLSYGLGDAHALSIAYGRDGRPVRFSGASDPRGAGLAKVF
jgi:gamma-glutamyltranspeptidase